LANIISDVAKTHTNKGYEGLSSKPAKIKKVLMPVAPVVNCPHCGVSVGKNNLQKHIKTKCVKSPYDLPPKRKAKATLSPVKVDDLYSKNNAVKSSAVLRNNASKGSTKGWIANLNRSAEELRALYAGKPLPSKPVKSIGEKVVLNALNICCVICKTKLTARNLDKHYSKVHHIEEQALKAIDSTLLVEVEESFNDRWLRLFSDKGYSVAMVQAFRRDAHEEGVSIEEMNSLLDVIKPIKKPVEATATVSYSAMAPIVVEAPVAAPVVTTVHPEKSFKVEINTTGRSQADQTKFRRTVSLNFSHRCAITGDAVAVEAAHIQTHKDYYDNSIDNGIMLSVGLHRLFDAGILIINPETMTVSFTHDCFYKKHLEGVQVKQGKIPISKEKIEAKNKQ